MRTGTGLALLAALGPQEAVPSTARSWRTGPQLGGPPVDKCHDTGMAIHQNLRTRISLDNRIGNPRSLLETADLCERFEYRLASPSQSHRFEPRKQIAWNRAARDLSQDQMHTSEESSGNLGCLSLSRFEVERTPFDVLEQCQRPKIPIEPPRVVMPPSAIDCDGESRSC